ncbi:hypothetical protein FKZ61_007110 [Litorilinea aerophila]|uniref:FesM n=1 Tax=Litorilinea aerophila TaxID=1204385 RepID=A0A540VKJ9_9CHLR|nr:FesM [Litorilinea aerophila]MCC9075876.1 hypothetical protein [Litorilinea aerophila]OUC05385.1 hypothetical protein RY27_27620 [Litorilinea aerophila]
MLNTIQNRRHALDLLRLPLLGRLLRWKHSRTAAQLLLFGLAAIIVIDGLVGSPLASRNVATVAAWVHYRGLVVLALLLVGNLFCAACPFILSRKLAKWLGRPRHRWPRPLRNKWLALASLVAILYVYELYDLWASPWWTAWLAVAYFVAAFVLEAFFTRDAFCLYLCPLGTFNFLYSTVSPLQIQARDLQVCRECEGHECINGSDNQLGCQLELFVPTIQSNLNCTFCLDCVRACPYDNVALATRPPGDELFRQSWPHRLDLALLALGAAFLGWLNAFAMTPPAYRLEAILAQWLQTREEALVLGLIFLVGAVAGPLALAYLAAWWSRHSSGVARPLNRLVMGFAYGFVPLGMAIWLAHYLFHFLTGAMTLVPAFQTFLADTLGWPLLGEPNWALAARFVPPIWTIQLIQVLLVTGGLAMAARVTIAAGRRLSPERAWSSTWPWLLLLALLAVASVWVFLLPMEMRGSVLGG